MFKTDKYKIVFQRFGNSKSGKKLNTKCFIYQLGGVLIGFECAYTNPKDQYSKIAGKKIALTKALKLLNLDKVERAIIWQAFWNWTDSWSTQAYDKCPDCKEGVLIPSSCEVKCNYCEYSDVLNIDE